MNYILIGREPFDGVEFGGSEPFLYATVHLQRTGETMAPSFLRSAKALSTSLRSAFKDLATSPAETGLPAARIAFNTCSFINV